ncbi:MAG: penicillin-binding transpeptidase domain-containing protein, partial [Patescibacteria group bacterium]
FAPRRDVITAPHFVLYVKDWLVDYYAQELGDAQLAEQKVEEGGLTVVTTLDLTKQLIGEEILRSSAEKHLKRAGASNAGLVALDPRRGEILTMVGSVDYFQDQFGAFNVTTSARQPGSAFKPIVYAAAFKEKYNPAFVLFDLRTDFGKYEPDNFDGGFRGPVTIRQALGNSLNIPAVKILALIGLDNALATSRDLGITTLTDKDRYGLSLVLGGGEVKPLEMATAFGVFANNGVLVPTSPILKITNSKNKILYDRTEEPKDAKPVLDPQVAYQISNILSDTEAKKPVFSRTLGVLTLNGRPAASKTGTTNGFRDAWTIGYTPQFVTAVWAGNNDNSPMNRSGGAIAAAPIWDEFMEKIHAGLPVEQFNRPEGIKDIEVDRLSNKLPVDGSEVIKDIFATWQVPKTRDDVHQKVRVCRENGLPADSDIPNELTEDRVFTNIHSEFPQRENWENPVINWAKSNGLYNPPPTGRCLLGSGDSNQQPQVAITSPASESVLSTDFTITANGSAPSGIRQIEFHIDGVSIGTDSTEPYSIEQKISQLSADSHTLTAILTSNSGSTASNRITVSVSKDTTAPANVTNFNGIPGPGIGRVFLTWVNPTDSDFALVRIYVSLDSTGAPVRTVDVNAPTNAATIATLNSGVAYRFIARSVDATGNQSSGVKVVLVAP